MQIIDNGKVIIATWLLSENPLSEVEDADQLGIPRPQMALNDNWRNISAAILGIANGSLIDDKAIIERMIDDGALTPRMASPDLIDMMTQGLSNSVLHYSDLPASEDTDTKYIVRETDVSGASGIYNWDGSAWTKIADYISQDVVDTKQDKVLNAENHIQLFDAQGNAEDSSKTIATTLMETNGTVPTSKAVADYIYSKLMAERIWSILIDEQFTHEQFSFWSSNNFTRSTTQGTIIWRGNQANDSGIRFRQLDGDSANLNLETEKYRVNNFLLDTYFQIGKDNGSNGGESDVFFRFGSDGNGTAMEFYMFYSDSSDSNFELHTIKNWGSVSQIYFQDLPISKGTPHNLKILKIDNTVWVWIDGILLVQNAGDTYTATGITYTWGEIEVDFIPSDGTDQDFYLKNYFKLWTLDNKEVL